MQASQRSAQRQADGAGIAKGEWGVVISLEGRLRATDETFRRLQESGDQAVTLEFVRQALALPPAQRMRLMAFLHLAGDASAVTADLNVLPSGTVELRLTAPGPAEA
jgi:hypothetical protein